MVDAAIGMKDGAWAGIGAGAGVLATTGNLVPNPTVLGSTPAMAVATGLAMASPPGPTTAVATGLLEATPPSPTMATPENVNYACERNRGKKLFLISQGLYY